MAEVDSSAEWREAWAPQEYTSTLDKPNMAFLLALQGNDPSLDHKPNPCLSTKQA